jgi:HEPN superfamily AbiU2-like protein
MESEIRKLFWLLHEEVLYLFYRWKIYQQLFGSGDENLDLLNRSGSNVFHLLQVLTEDNVYLTLSRLTDPEKSAGHDNLSLTYLLKKLEPTLSAELQKHVREGLDTLKEKTQSARDHRNKRIAHLDVSYAKKVEPLSPVDQHELDETLGLLESIMRELHRAISDADTRYKDPAIAYGCDGDHLLGVLRDAHQQRV